LLILDRLDAAQTDDLWSLGERLLELPGSAGQLAICRAWSTTGWSWPAAGCSGSTGSTGPARTGTRPRPVSRSGSRLCPPNCRGWSGWWPAPQKL